MDFLHADLATLLDALELALPDMLARHPDEADFWSEFAGEADEIVERAEPGESAYVRGRIDCMLRNTGLIPGENEGDRCE